MSQIVTSFDPTTLTETSFPAPNSSGNGALVFFNESNASIDLSFADGSSLYLPAWYHRSKCGETGSVNITWTIRQILNSSSPPISAVIVEAFRPGEKYPADGPLVRQANVGNTINTVGGTANAIKNDNNLAATSIIEATVAGDGASAVSLSNDAQMNLGSALHPGGLQMTGSGAFVKTPILAGLGGDNLAIEAANGFGTRFFSGGNFVGYIDATGLNLLLGTITLLTGSVSRISKFSGTAPNVSTAFNHGLGAVPDIVLLQVTGTSNALSMVKYDVASLTSTQVSIVSDSSRAFVGLAIKF